jgi:hypothetical protein
MNYTRPSFAAAVTAETGVPEARRIEDHLDCIEPVDGVHGAASLLTALGAYP